MQECMMMSFAYMMMSLSLQMTSSCTLVGSVLYIAIYLGLCEGLSFISNVSTGLASWLAHKKDSCSPPKAFHSALPPPPHTAPVGDECTQHGSSREGNHKDGVGETHSSTSTETSSGGFWDLAWHENKNVTKRMTSL